MRQSIHKISQHNLASSKRSIVIAVAGLAMLLGTTSAGTVSFFSRDDRLNDNAAANPLTDIANPQSREVPLGWPAFTVLQGQDNVLSSTSDTTPEITVPEQSINISPGTATIVLDGKKEADTSEKKSDAQPAAGEPAQTEEQPVVEEPATDPSTDTPPAEDEPPVDAQSDASNEEIR